MPTGVLGPLASSSFFRAQPSTRVTISHNDRLKAEFYCCTQVVTQRNCLQFYDVLMCWIISSQWTYLDLTDKREKEATNG